VRTQGKRERLRPSVRWLAGGFAALIVAATVGGFGLIPPTSAEALAAPAPAPAQLADEAGSTAAGLGGDEAALVAGTGGVTAGGAEAGGSGGLIGGVITAIVGLFGVAASWNTDPNQGLDSMCASIKGVTLPSDLTSQCKNSATTPNVDVPAGGYSWTANIPYLYGNVTVTLGSQLFTANDGTQWVAFTESGVNYPSPYLVGYDASGNEEWSGSASTSDSQDQSNGLPTGATYLQVPTQAPCFELNVGGTGSGADAFSSCTSGGPAMVATKAGGSTDPQRYFMSVATFADGTTQECKSATFTETDATLPPFCTVPDPSKSALEDLVIREWLADGSSSQLIADIKPSPEYQADATQYPDCAAGSCQLQVYVRGQACTVGATACEDWIHDDANADDITCEYGPASNPTEYTPPLSDCAQLAPYYKPANQAAGTPYATPIGKPTTAPTTKPNPSSSTTPSSSGQDCFGNTYGTFDPLEWVEKPIECAAQ